MPSKRRAAAAAAQGQAALAGLIGSPVFQGAGRTGRRLRSTWGGRWRSTLAVLVILTATSLAVGWAAELPRRERRQWPLVLAVLGILGLVVWVQRHDRRLLTILASLTVPLLLLGMGLYASMPGAAKPATRQAATVSVMGAGAWASLGGVALDGAGWVFDWVPGVGDDQPTGEAEAEPGGELVAP
jgi:hypothetical protein